MRFLPPIVLGAVALTTLSTITLLTSPARFGLTAFAQSRNEVDQRLPRDGCDADQTDSNHHCLRCTIAASNLEIDVGTSSPFRCGNMPPDAYATVSVQGSVTASPNDGVHGVEVVLNYTFINVKYPTAVYSDNSIQPTIDWNNPDPLPRVPRDYPFVEFSIETAAAVFGITPPPHYQNTQAAVLNATITIRAWPAGTTPPRTQQ